LVPPWLALEASRIGILQRIKNDVSRTTFGYG
jgi:hypothetical protein